MAFDLGEALADALAGVSKPDTGREQIEYIDLSLICEDPENFYSLTNIEDLAANIATCGLQQPIRVRRHPDEDGRYIIVSGHRRFAALEMLVKDDAVKWSEAPCIVQQEDISPELQQLQLIYANAHTRELSSADKMEQAKQVEELLYQLKEQGFEFPGRMREHVAAAVNASSTKLARLKVIRDNLCQPWMNLFKSNSLAESTAYALATMTENHQRILWDVYRNRPRELTSIRASDDASHFKIIDSLQCEKFPNVGGCINRFNMLKKSARNKYSFNYCRRCCEECSDLQKCKYSCVHAVAKRSALRLAAEKTKEEEIRTKAERDLPDIEYIEKVYRRVHEARIHACVSMEDYVRARGVIVTDERIKNELDKETGKGISANDWLPFGCYFSLRDAEKLCAAADYLGCSVDWLLGRDVPGPGEVLPFQPAALTALPEGEPRGGWRTGEPEEPGEYVVLTRLHAASNDFFADDRKWDGFQWERPSYDDRDVVYWMPFPEEE